MYGTGIYLENASNCMIEGVTGYDLIVGIDLLSSTGNSITDVHLSDMRFYGFNLESNSNFNQITDNTLIKSSGGSLPNFGIAIYDHSVSNTIHNNLIAVQGYGLYIWVSGENSVIGNSFIGDPASAGRAYISGSTYPDGLNVFYELPPTGGNYWSYWAPPYRLDNDGDGFVDQPYTIYSGQTDYYPLAVPPHPWEPPEDPPPWPP